MKFNKTVISMVVATAVFSTDLVLAQASGSGFALEEVIVTARKREESLQSTPIAVSAFSEKELEYRQIDSTDKLSEVTPNLIFDSVAPSSGSSSAAQIYIRGIGQLDFTPVTDPGVGLYIDGIYMSRSVGNVLDFLDLDRVEVLRGPQGTLFGRNTIGGAVAIYSKKPEENLSGNMKVQVGDDNMLYVSGKVNLPISDQLLSNFAISSRKRDGYVTRIYDGIKTGDDDSLSARGSLLWSPRDNFNLYVTADGTRIRENGAPTVSGPTNDKQAFPTFGNGVLDSCAAVVINNGGFGPPAFGAGGPPSFPGPGVGAGGAPGCVGANSFVGPYTSTGTFPVKSDLDIWGVSAELSWDANDWLMIKSITGYREMEMESWRDADNTPANIQNTRDFYEHEQFSQELQFSGTLLQDSLKWILGLYYFQEEGFDINPVILPVGSIQSGGLYDNESIATFFQATYDMTNKLSLTFGVRYTEDTKQFTPDQFSLGDASAGGFFPNTWTNYADQYLASSGPVPAGERLLPYVESKAKFDDTNIMLNLAYQWTDKIMTYFTYSEGFKSGGFDQRFSAPAPAPTSFKPETAESYELGFKSDLFDDRVRLNIAVFHTDYEALQLSVRETFNRKTFNGGDADIDGAEVELTWVPTDRWYVTAALGYMDAEYVRLDPSVPLSIDNKLVNTPELSTSIGVAYSFDLQDWGTLTPRLDWSYHGEQENDAVNSPQLHQESYDLLNAAISFETNDGRWESILAFRNITDETFLITGNSGYASSSGYVERVYGRPFEWYLSVRYNFF